jgi:hypothetical protein
MFPSFRSLRDRQQKLDKLAADNQKELQIQRIKYEKYKLAEWASDMNDTTDISKLLQKTKNDFTVFYNCNSN